MSASSPGSYNQAIAHVDNTSRLREGQNKKRNAQIAYNKQLADTHRAAAQSFDAGIQVEAQARGIAHDFEDYFKKIDQEFQMKAFDQARESSIRNADQRVEEVNRKTQETVNFVNRVLDTGVDVYKKVQEGQETQRKTEAAYIATQFQTTEQLTNSTKLKNAFISGEIDQDEFNAQAKAAGIAPEVILKLPNVSSGAYTLAYRNLAQNDINNMGDVIAGNTTDEIAGIGKTGSQVSTVAEANVAWRQYMQSYMRQYKQNTGFEFPADHFWDITRKSQARYVGNVSRIERTQAAARLESEGVNKLNHALKAQNGVDAQLGYLTERFNRPILRDETIRQMNQLSKHRGSAITTNLIDKLSLTPILGGDGKPIGQTYGDKYFTEFAEIKKNLRSHEIAEQQDKSHQQRGLLNSFKAAVGEKTRNGQMLTAAGAQKIREDAIRDGLLDLGPLDSFLEARTMSDGPGIAESEAGWKLLVRADPYLENVSPPDVVRLGNGNDKWTNNKLKELRIAQAKNPYVKDGHKWIGSDLRDRLDLTETTAREDKSFIAAHRHLSKEWEENARRAGGGQKGFDAARAIYVTKYGDDKKERLKGPLRVFDQNTDPGKTGFVEFQADVEGWLDKGGTYTNWSTGLGGEGSTIRERVANLHKIDTITTLPARKVEKFLTDFYSGNISADNDDTMDNLRTLADALYGVNDGGNKGMLIAAQELANVYGIDYKQIQQQQQPAAQSTGLADSIINKQNEKYIELQGRFGGEVAEQVVNGVSVRGEPHTGGANYDAMIFPSGYNLKVASRHRVDPLAQAKAHGDRDYNEPRPQGHNHHGEDIAMPTGTQIIMSQGGTVLESTFDSVGGNSIYIKFDDGTLDRYLHLDERFVSGGRVTPGMVIGTVGNTGRSYGSHLHWESYASGGLQGGDLRDPMTAGTPKFEFGVYGGNQ